MSLRLRLGAAIIWLSLLSACSHSPPDRVQGYVEGEFVYVASPLGGTLESLSVLRGMQVQRGDLLFSLDSASEKHARDDAEWQLRQARANLEDAKQGKRPSEIESLDAQLKQARAALVLAEAELGRQSELAQIPGTVALQDLDRARSARDEASQRVVQLEADLATARLGARTNQVAAAEAAVQTMEARLARAQWDYSQKSKTAPQAGLVFDTLYREGEWVAAGRPVVVLLPPQNIKARAFVPEPHVGAIHPGDRVEVFVDGTARPFDGKVGFISPQAEYTPPVIYSKESRAKLVFMIEILFDPEVAINLHPGQPVDVQFAH